MEREIRGLNFGQVKLDTVLSTARHRCDISSEGAVLPEHNNTEVTPAYSLHVSAQCNEYNERLDLFKIIFLI